MARTKAAKSQTFKTRASAGVAACLAAATVAGVVNQPPAPVQLLASAASSTHSQVSADYNLLSLVEYQVPGTGSTVPNPPSGTPDVSWLDSGIWSQIPERYALMDSDDYPATLEQSGPRSGTNSVNKGATTLVSWILKNDPNTTVIVGAGGSQGALVWYETLNRLAAMGYPMENVFVAIYSDPAMPVTGILARFAPGDPVLTTGLKGGAPTLPTTGTYVRVVNDGDPMAFFPKDLWNLPAVASAVAGFMFLHGKLGYIDWNTADITVDGNVTTAVVHPFGDTVALLAPLVMMNAPTQLVTFLNKLIRPIIVAGGMYEPGLVQTTPTLESIVRQASAAFQGFVDAMRYATQLLSHQPTSIPGTSTPVPSPTGGLIDEAEERDNELNGTAGSSESSLPADVVASGSPEITTPQLEVTTPQQPAASVQPEAPEPPIQEVDSSPTQQHEPESSDESDNSSDNDASTSPTDSVDRDDATSGKSDDDRRGSTTTEDPSDSDNGPDAESDDSSQPKPKVQSQQGSTTKHDSSDSPSGSAGSASSSNSGGENT